MNAPKGTRRGLAKLPPPPRGMTREQASYYRRYGKLLLDAGTLAATDLPMLEAAARVMDKIDDLYALQDAASPATLAALERLHKEQLVQLGLTPQARRAVQRLEAPSDAEGDRLRSLLG